MVGSREWRRRSVEDANIPEPGVKKPWAVIVAECFLLFVLGLYFAKVCVLSMGLIAEVGSSRIMSKNLFVFLCEIVMFFITADAMLGLSSRRPKGWKKAVRGSMLLLLFTLIGSFFGVTGSVSVLVTINPVIVAPLVLFVILLMLLPSVRRYYVPPMECEKSLLSWIKFSFVSELYPQGRYRISYPDGDERNCVEVDSGRRRRVRQRS